MIDKIDERIRAWVTESLGPVSVSFEAPVDARGGAGACLYLIGLGETYPTQASAAYLAAVELRYLVTTWAETALDAHRLLGNLVMAALSNPSYLVDLAPVSPELWLALSARPRPGFMLRVPMRQQRPEPTAPPVTRPLAVNLTPMLSFEGRVVGPGDTPLPGARISIPTLNLAANSDLDGYFTIPSIPAGYQVRQVQVAYKSYALTVSLDAPPQPGRPCLIRFNPTMEKRS